MASNNPPDLSETQETFDCSGAESAWIQRDRGEEELGTLTAPCGGGDTGTGARHVARLPATWRKRVARPSHAGEGSTFQLARGR